MRKRIFEIIEAAKDNDLQSRIYDIIMMIVIFASLLPLTVKEVYPAFVVLDKICALIFIIDYLLRWITADYKLEKGNSSFLEYPLTGGAVIDLLAILPSFDLLASGFRILKVFRLLKTFRVFRVFRFFKLFRYSKNIQIILSVIKKQKDALIAVGILAVAYILLLALIIFNIEPQTFDDFYEAIYWATVSLTTLGYGDIFPVTPYGRLITMLSAIVGVAIVALPAGILTAGYMEELYSEKIIKEENKSEGDE